MPLDRNGYSKQKVLHAGQAGSFQYPDEERLRRDRQMTETCQTMEKLQKDLREVKPAGVAKDKVEPNSQTQSLKGGDDQTMLRSKSRELGRAAHPALSAGTPVQTQLTLDLDRFGISGADQVALA